MALPILGLVKGAIGIGSAIAKGIKKLKEAKKNKQAAFEDDSQYYNAPAPQVKMQTTAGRPDGFGAPTDPTGEVPLWKQPIGMAGIGLLALVVLKKLKVF